MHGATICEHLWESLLCVFWCPETRTHTCSHMCKISSSFSAIMRRILPHFSFVWWLLTLQYIILLPSANDKVDKENNQHSSSYLLSSSFSLLCMCSSISVTPESFGQNQGIFLFFFFYVCVFVHMCVCLSGGKESLCSFQVYIPAIWQVCLCAYFPLWVCANVCVHLCVCVSVHEVHRQDAIIEGPPADFTQSTWPHWRWWKWIKDWRESWFEKAFQRTALFPPHTSIIPTIAY